MGAFALVSPRESGAPQRPGMDLTGSSAATTIETGTPVSPVPVTKAIEGRSLGAIAWMRLKRDKLTMAALSLSLIHI